VRVDPDDKAWLSEWAANAIVPFDPQPRSSRALRASIFTGPARIDLCRQFAQAQQVWDELRRISTERSQHLGATMGLNWKSVKAVHVTQACEALLDSAGSRPEPRGLIVIYKDKQLPAKTILRIAYCLANNIPSETKLKFASSEGSLQLLRSLGFRAERLQTSHPVAATD
jgi:hypothetical protein